MEHGFTGPPRSHSAWFNGIVLALACLGFGLALSGFAATGANMRYSGDDYCYSAVLAEHGFWQTQTFAYLSVTTYAGNRFSVNLVAATASLVGPLANAVLPGLVLVLWIGGMTWLLRELYRAARRPRHLIEWLLAAGAVAFFVLQASPNLSQSFYWSAGLLSYLMPITVNTYLAALAVNRFQSSAHLRLSVILVLALAFLAAGFSETMAAVQTGFYALALLAAGTAALKASRSRAGAPVDTKLLVRAVWLTSAALLGAVLAMAVLALSPANALRQSALPHPPGLLALVRMSLYNAYFFTRAAISNQFWLLACAGLLFLSLGLLSAMRQPQSQTRPARYILGVLACAGVGYLLVVCAMAPSVYAETSYPDLRVLIVPWWITAVETGGFGWLTGQAVAGWLRPKLSADWRETTILATCVVVLAVCALPSTAAVGLYSALPRYERWARYWDARNALIWQASRENQGRVEVMQIDHIIQDVSDLSPNPAFWYNVCAARYYGVKQIVADLPGWDK